jgi:GT2 family glycosyltransferase
VSVILPCRRPDHLESQLRAVTSQGCTEPWELIVVDNGCPLPLEPMIAAGASASAPVRLVRAGGRIGLGYARNVGAAEAAGSKLVFCDADDVCGDGWLGALAAALDSVELAGGPLVDWSPADGAVRGVPGIPRAFGRIPFFPTANFAVRRSAFEQLGGFDEWFDPFGGCEDVDLCWRAGQAGHRLALAPDAVVYHRRRQGLGALMRQQCRNGRAELAFASRHASHGFVRMLGRYELRRLAFMLRHLPDVVRSAKARRRWLTWIAKRAGWVTFMLSADRRAPGAPSAAMPVAESAA